MNALADIEPLKSFTLEEVLNVPPEKIDEVEAKLLKLPGIKLAEDYPLEHHFAPGIYIRQILMPAGDFIMGHRHNTTHANMVIKGRAAVMIDGVLHHIVAPCMLNSGPGVRKVLYILEDMIWATIHANPDDTTDIPTLEERLSTKTPAFKEFEADRQRLLDFMNAQQIPDAV